jgi:hypothetical protein
VPYILTIRWRVIKELHLYTLNVILSTVRDFFAKKLSVVLVNARFQ